MIKITVMDDTDDDNVIVEYNAEVAPHWGDALWVETAAYSILSVSHVIHNGKLGGVCLKVQREQTRP